MHRRAVKYTTHAAVLLAIALLSNVSARNTVVYPLDNDFYVLQGDTDKPDTGEIELPYPFTDQSWNPYSEEKEGGLYLETPSNIKSSVNYDPNTGNYYFRQFFGKDSIDYRRPTYMDLYEYLNYDMERSMKEYWQEKQEVEELNQGSKGWRPTLHVKGETFDRIFGGNTVDIRPNGSAELIFAANVSRTDNPAIPEKQRRIGTFDFNEKIQLNVIGNIGDKLKLTTNYNTEATFDFENQMKLEYTGYEDEIIQKIEAGNVTLPLSGSLITGSQSLFGIKTALRFGRLTVTSVLSQQRGKKSEIEVQGGAQVQEFEVTSDNYEDNKHFFLSQYMKDQYETAVASPPLLNTGINITKIEVWVTNTTTAYDDTRNIIAFQDLGEGDTNEYFNSSYVQDLDITSTLPDNDANNLYQKMTAPALAGVRAFTAATALLNAEGLIARQDYQKIELARKLSSSEYTLNAQLGYISLNQELQTNQALAIAFQYTYRGNTYQVGEFSTDGITGENALFLKLLKSTELNTHVPMWNLMMKNVYALGAYQVQRDGFDLQIWYLDRETGVDINYIPEGNISGVPLLKALGFDKLNSSNALGSDGAFDFLSSPQITINPNNGRIFFPLLEPFGSGLRAAIGDQQIADKYTFDSLYTTTKADAQVKFPDKNRFTIKGTYQSSSSSDISLNAINIPDGSVTVSAGGQQLQENVDYTVDYTLGRVKIINQGILESGTPIKISLESNSLFNIQSKTLFASRFDYKISDDFILGGTVMNLTERPLTQKVNIGDEPISNTIWGIDGNYRTESRFLTKLVDKIPLIDTKEKSSVTFSGEFAQLLPGHSKAVGKDGTSYIDDFEGSQSAIDIRSFTTWSIASTPQGQTSLFPEGELNNNLAFNFNRAKLGWYVIDPLFFRNNNITPDHIKDDPAMQSNHYMREVFEQEVFPNKDIDPGQPSNIPVFDLAFYPKERGPYNYDVDGKDINGDVYASGLAPDGTLIDPDTRWGGIMRRIETNDFDAANIEFIQFWVMDPFVEEDYMEIHPDADFTQAGGYLYFNLGNISEDILRDGVKSFENGLPTTESEVADTSDLDPARSVWGRVPTTQSIVSAFDNDIESRKYQDVGLDGLRNQEEGLVFKNDYLDKIANLIGTSAIAYQNAQQDPSADDFNYFRDDDYDAAKTNIVDRYKLYNGLEGNSPTAEQSATLNSDGYPTSASTLPNAEDINRDNTLDDIESYFQYKVKITPQDINPNNVGNNYITDVLPATVTTKDGRSRSVYWYQFKIPIRDPEKVVGNIADFRSIRFIRMFMKGFKEPVNLRFARLELIRGEWRKYLEDLDEDGEYLGDEDQATFDISAVNIEENGSRQPVNYVLPPDIQRELNFGTTNLTQLNEQALSISVCGLEDGKAKAAYKSAGIDVRSYKRLKMYVHAEAVPGNGVLNNGDLRIFVRLGTDFENNYYEYEIPLNVTPPGSYNNDSQTDRETVWPATNNLDIELVKLQSAKIRRNSDMLNPQNGITVHTRYRVMDGANNIYVTGNPDMSLVKTIMIGIRNPKKDASNPNDDGLAKCAIIWVNELRLSEFDNKGGWAAIGRVQTRLADFANISLAGSMSTPGFGSIEKKVSERQKETIQNVDASASVELGKFLGEKSGMRIPMYVGFAQSVSKPQYDPFNNDIELSDALSDASPQYADSIKDMAKNLSLRRSINFTNVRKEKGKNAGKPHIYDVENLSLTYAYSYEYRRNVDFAGDHTKTYRGGLSYNFGPQPKSHEPFKKVKLFSKSKYLRPLKEFNFYTMPRQLSFRTDVNRIYNERETRNTQPNVMASLPPFYTKNFTWNRTYNLKYDLTKSLKLDFSANNLGLIGEPDGVVNRKFYPDSFEIWKDSVKNSVREFGINTHYHHTTSINYTIPLSKFPLTNWINSTARYSANYDWMRASFAADSLGNTVQNSNQTQLNASANMLSLYNKVGYFKKVNRKFRNKKRSNNSKKSPKTNVKPSSKDSTNTKKRDKNKNRITVMDRTAKLLMSLKNVSATYSRSRGTMLPGYGRTSHLMGMDNGFDAPGTGFIFGQQDNFGEDGTDFAEYAARNDWLIQEENLNSQYSRTFTENLNLRASMQPISDMRIEFTANKNNSLNNTEFFRWNSDSMDFERESPVATGNYSVSFLSWRTAFAKDDDNYLSSVFQSFLDNRTIISKRLNEKNANSVGQHQNEADYSDGYGSTSQDVLIPAFLAAYSGTTPNQQGLSPFMSMPKPNWRITYNGLSKIKLLKKYFKTVTLSHAYRSTYSVSGFTSNLLFVGDQDGFPQSRDANANFIPEYQINTVTISEQFSPLLNIDMTWNNSLQTRVEVKKDRSLSLSFSNNQLTEIRGSEYVVGAGYRFENVKFPIKFKRGKTIQSDLNLRADVSLRNNRTIIRKIVENINQPTAGQRVISIKISADYVISQRLNLRLFYDRISTKPVISQSFPTANTNAGLSIRFTLSS